MYLRGKAYWLTRAPKRFPQLEELHISLGFINVKDIEVIGRNCPQLKSFTVNKVFQWSHNDEHALAVANYMPELRHLDLCGSNMTNDGLEAILIGCPHLESLDVRMCSNLNLEGNLGKLCTERIKDFMRPNDSSDNCGYHLLSYEFYHELHVYMCFAGVEVWCPINF
ncbi:unnamed protein product [Lactuca virosa]|uniref:F-box/LRR-repeat protein 15/At3g58940/PEG3-like LRR domain-containing protein n=1 Tax=Lactuca virosa TaxID=75947 RepID=A0AAU9PF90_9ASTR|nr:unnamed protein product [Lactuca virosa]